MAERDYILGMKYKDIASKYNVSENTVKSWKKRHRWERVRTAKKSAPIAPQKKGCTQKSREAPVEMEEELSDQEQLFCYHYVRTWNATQAAFKAGYASSGNKYSAQVLGSRILRRPRVATEIERLRQLFRQEIHVDIQDFLAFCMKIVGADVGDYLKFGQKEVPIIGMYGPLIDKKTKKPLMETINYIDFAESDQLDTSIIQEVKQGKDGISIKLADKKWAWEQLIKYFDWLPDKWQRQVDQQRLDLERKKVDAVTETLTGGSGVTIIDDVKVVAK